MLSFRLITFRWIILIIWFTLKDHWFDSHRLPKSNMAPRGLLKILCMYIHLKINYNTFVNLPLHLLHSYVFSLLSQTHLHLCFICSSENRRRFVVGTFLVVYESFPMVWICLWLLPWTARGKTKLPAELRKGREKQNKRPLSHTFVLKINSSFFLSFRSKPRPTWTSTNSSNLSISFW